MIESAKEIELPVGIALGDMPCQVVIGQFVIGQFVIGQFNKPITFKVVV